MIISNKIAGTILVDWNNSSDNNNRCSNSGSMASISSTKQRAKLQSNTGSLTYLFIISHSTTYCQTNYETKIIYYQINKRPNINPKPTPMPVKWNLNYAGGKINQHDKYRF
ncbi:MAG: hypothetical protein WDA42_07810 [Candidatus Bathyarchaeia archaeon]